MNAEGLELGQRVWVADALQPEGRAFGQIASLPEVYLNGYASFVVMLDGRTPTAITCCVERRGSQWDFAEEGEANSRPGVSGAASVAPEGARP
jgi:hypothetical protein